MSRLLLTMHDPWMAACLAQALRDDVAGIATYGGETEAARFAAMGIRALLVPPADEATTLALLHDDAVAAFVAEAPSRLVCFKPSRRLEQRASALGARLASTPAAIAQPLENKLALRQLAAEAGIDSLPEESDPVGLPAQAKLSVREGTEVADLRAAVGAGPSDPVVVQSPRGFMGRRTWLVDGPKAWASVREDLAGRQVRVSQFATGRPGTLNAVVDAAGTVLCTAPIVQVTGEPQLTPYPLGSCGNDFTWRPAPHPADGPWELARRLGPVLAARGYRGHFGLDFVVEDRSDAPARTWLIEINPRLTASMALYSAWRPILARAHVAVLDGSDLRSTGELPSLEGGQLLVHNLTDGPQGPLSAPRARPSELLPGAGNLAVWPQVTTEVAPGGTRGRLIQRGPVVSDDGSLVISVPG